MNTVPDNNASRTLQLRDGRQLGYAEYGSAQGHPLLYFHGLPGSRYECGLLNDAAAALNIRLVAPDRPGYGLSSYQPNRQLAQWPDDVIALADALGIDRFSILGVSGGGPCALACARAIPPRIAAAAVVCGLGPVADAPLQHGMSWFARLAFALAGSAPAALAALYGAPLRLLSQTSPTLALRTLAWYLGAPDKQVLLRPEILALLSRTLREAFRQGWRGAMEDVRIYRNAWRFDVSDIRLPVHFWHGDTDPIVPLAHSQYLHARLSHSRLSVVPGEGHFSLPVLHAGTILETLLQDTRTSNSI